MSENISQLLWSFDALPSQEQHEFLTAILRRTNKLPASIISDEGLVAIADELFQGLDAEESNGDHFESL